MKERSKFLATAFVAALCAGFAACGDDSSGGGGDGGETGTVKKLSDLGTCISALEGDRYRVEEMDGDYVCTSGKWTPVSSLGECSDSLLGKVRSETNRGMEGYGESFACAVLDSLPGWRSATETEGALGMACVEGFEGKFARDTSKENSAWVCASGAWREASAAESAAGKICDASSEGAFARDSVKKDSVAIYVCSDSLWREIEFVYSELSKQLSGKPNVVFKVPGVYNSLEVVRRVTAEGIGVNITVNFSVSQCEAFAEVIEQGIADQSFVTIMAGRLDNPVGEELSKAGVLNSAELCRNASRLVTRRVYQQIILAPILL